jgi:hypothetical protein
MTVTVRHAQFRETTAAGDAPEERLRSRDQRVAGARADADAAFRVMYAEHGPALLRLSSMLTGSDRGRDEDLVQEACCVLELTVTTWTISIAHPPG